MTEIKSSSSTNLANLVTAPSNPTPQQQLKLLKQQQGQLQQWLNQVNNKLYEIETQYLDDTPLGSIIRGWDIDGKTAPPSYRSKNNIDERERLFSFSSIAFMQEKKASLANPVVEKSMVVGSNSKATINNTTGTTSNKGRKRKKMSTGSMKQDQSYEDWNNYDDY